MDQSCRCGRIRSTKCFHKLCGNCCNDKLCNKHISRKRNKKIQVNDADTQSETTISDSEINTKPNFQQYSDSELDIETDHLTKVQEILYENIKLPMDIAKCIMSYIDKRENCIECDKLVGLYEYTECNFCSLNVCKICLERLPIH